MVPVSARGGWEFVATNFVKQMSGGMPFRGPGAPCAQLHYNAHTAPVTIAGVPGQMAFVPHASCRMSVRRSFVSIGQHAMVAQFVDAAVYIPHCRTRGFSLSIENTRNLYEK
jgi:hypothetical protein